AEHPFFEKQRDEKQCQINGSEHYDQSRLASQHAWIRAGEREEQRTGQREVHHEADKAVDVAIVHEAAQAGEVAQQKSEEDGNQGKREDGDHSREWILSVDCRPVIPRWFLEQGSQTSTLVPSPGAVSSSSLPE